jgi:uncharacterized protein (TIGR02246 family)
VTAGDEVRATLAAFDAAFAAGDASALAEAFSEDAQLLLLYSEPIVGREVIRERWARFFAAWDTSAWRTEPRIVDVHADRAYTQSTYTETLVARPGGTAEGRPRERVVGRHVAFLRRETAGQWRIWLLMNSHVRPTEQLPGEGP